MKINNGYSSNQVKIRTTFPQQQTRELNSFKNTSNLVLGCKYT